MRLFCIIPCYKEYPNRAISSIAEQVKAPYFTMCIIDEPEKMVDAIETRYLYLICSTKFRMYAAFNMQAMISYLAGYKRLESGDVICLIDGDDWLYDENALITIWKEFQNKNVWLTYGSYVNLSDIRENKPHRLFRGRYRNEENYRELPWRASHLKAFRYGLYKKIRHYWWKDSNGKDLKVCSDLALMFPMLEMAGKEHIRHINKPLYVYNDLNPDNDHKVAGKEQKDVEMWLRSLEPYKKVKSI